MDARFACSLAIVVGIAISQCGSTQFAQSTQTSNKNSVRSATFMTWSATMWNVLLAAPALARLARGRCRASDGSIPAESIETPRSLLLGGAVGQKPATFLGRVLFFYAAWLVANYAYQRALTFIAASLVATLFSTAPAFVAVGSISVLGRPLTGLGWLAVACSILGSTLVAKPWNGAKEGDSLVVGVLFALLSSFAAACYKVAFKALFADPQPVVVGVILGWIGVYAATLGSLLLAAVLASGAESVQWADVPWDTLIASNVMSLSFNFLIGWGIAISYPLFISLGTVLNVPLNIIVDAIFRSRLPDAAQACGIGSIVLGFLLLLYCDWRERKQQAASTINDEECSEIVDVS